MGKRSDRDQHSRDQQLGERHHRNDMPSDTHSPENPEEDMSDNVVPMNNAIDFAPAADEQPPVPATPLEATLYQMRSIDRNFNPDAFAGQAEVAYEAIVTAFAKGDRQVLADLLSEEVYNNFMAAIDAREEAGEVMSTDLLSLKSAEITDAQLQGRNAEITVRFETEMISVTRDEDGEVVSGDPNPHVVREFWTFARDLKSRNPNWLLITTKSAD